MRLLRLLATGRSLVGWNKPTPQYHMRRQGMLPRFSPRQNPFRAASQPEAPVPAPKAESPAPEAALATVSAGSPAGAGWLARLRKLRLGRKLRDQSGAKAGLLRQSELSLDGVTVVRNDFSDTDFEVKQASARANGPAERPRPGLAASRGDAWSRVTSRIFGAGQS